MGSVLSHSQVVGASSGGCALGRVANRGERECEPTSEVGGAQPGNRFVSFVRAYARSSCLVELDLKFCWSAFSLFLFSPS